MNAILNRHDDDSKNCKRHLRAWDDIYPRPRVSKLEISEFHTRADRRIRQFADYYTILGDIMAKYTQIIDKTADELKDTLSDEQKEREQL